MRYRCKLELWDDDEGLENGSAPDLDIDRTSRTNLGRNKYVDSLADDDDYRHMDVGKLSIFNDRKINNNLL